MNDYARKFPCPYATLAVLIATSVAQGNLHAEGIPEPGLILYGVVGGTSGGQAIRVTSGTLIWTFQPSDGGAAVSVRTSLTNLNDQFSFVVQIPCESPLDNLNPQSRALRIQNPPLSYNRANATLDGKSLTLKDSTQANFVLSGAMRGLVQRVDFEIPSPPDDYDAWALRNLGRTGNQNEDPDGDGMVNVAEFKAGTDPKDRNSLFKFIEVQPLANNAGTQIRWSSVAGRFYSILRSPTLSPNAADYTEIKSRILAAAPLSVYVDPEAVGVRIFFYRLRVDE